MAIPGNHDTRDGILFSLPFLVTYGLFLVFPIGFGLFISFFKWNILSGRRFIGLLNYTTIFSDRIFYSSLGHTAQFVLMTTPTLLLAGFLMALFVTSKSRLRSLAENVFFLPYILSITVIGTLWAWLFQKNFGLINQVLTALGNEPLGWLTDPRYAMGSVSIATLWWTAGFNMVLFSAGIKQIPTEVYESSEIDGAGPVRRLFSITIPLLKPTIVLCSVLQVIASFKVFGQVFVMTGGGPFGKTRVLIQYIYEAGFTYFKMGYASAMAYLLFMIILLVSLAQYGIMNRGTE